MRPSLRTTTITLALGACLGVPAWAAGCSKAPAAQWQPKSALSAQLEADGMKVRQIKTEGGCYEVYAVDRHGKRQNMAFNAQTLQKLDNPEAGEN